MTAENIGLPRVCPGRYLALLEMKMAMAMLLGRFDIESVGTEDGSEVRVPKDAIECPGNCESCGMCYELDRLGRDVVFHKH